MTTNPIKHLDNETLIDALHIALAEYGKGNVQLLPRIEELEQEALRRMETSHFIPDNCPADELVRQALALLSSGASEKLPDTQVGLWEHIAKQCLTYPEALYEAYKVGFARCQALSSGAPTSNPGDKP